MALFFKLLFSNSLKYKKKLTKDIDNWKDVYEKEIKPVKLKPNQLKVIGQSLYIEMLEKVIFDLNISDPEKTELDGIVKEFLLDDGFINSTKKSLADNAVRRLVQKQYEEKSLNYESKAVIIDFATYLQIDNAKLEKIGQRLYLKALEHVIIDLALSEPELMELNEIVKVFSLDDKYIKSAKESMNESAVKKLVQKYHVDKVLTHEEIALIIEFATYLELGSAKLSKIGQSLYLKKLEQAISDFDITVPERSQLDQIIKAFSVDDKYIQSAKQSLNETAVKKLVQRKYEDKVLTDDEKAFIIDFAAYLEFDSSKLEKIRSNIASSLLNAALNDKLSDKRLTPQEETELTQMLVNLQIDIAKAKEIIPDHTLQDLAFTKFLWQLENGIFTIISDPPVNMKKYEECYLSFQGLLLESKVITKGYTSGSQGISFRIAKGVSYRVGASRSVPIKQEVTLKHPGNLCLTSERVIFASTGENSFTIKFDKLLTFEVYSDGIGFVIEGWTYIVKLRWKQVQIFATGLTSSIRNYLDEENGVLQRAQREINQNSNFVNDIHKNE